MNKILKIIFIILVVTTLSEVGYYLYINSNKRNSPEKTTQNNVQIQANTVSPEKICTNASPTNDDIAKTLNIHKDYLPILRFKPNDSIRFKFTRETVGIIKNIKKEDKGLLFDFYTPEGKKFDSLGISKGSKLYKLDYMGNRILTDMSEFTEGATLMLTETYDMSRSVKENEKDPANKNNFAFIIL